MLLLSNRGRKGVAGPEELLNGECEQAKFSKMEASQSRRSKSGRMRLVVPHRGIHLGSYICMGSAPRSKHVLSSPHVAVAVSMNKKLSA